VDLSCAFATSLDTPAHVAVAESLGYRRAWCYDSPALYPDVWMALALAASRTSRIGLGPAVLVPSLRHPMTNAAAIAGLAAMAGPERVAVAVGAGFTGRYVLGQRAMRWADVASYVAVLRALLRGEEASWEGSVVRMIHPPGFVASRPVDVPVLIAADGPKGLEVARRLGDGVFSAGRPVASDDAPPWRALLSFGTVLDEREPVSSERVLAAAGHGLAVAYHAMYERGGAAVVDSLPGGAAWRAVVEATPVASRHLAVHDGHLVHLTAADRAALAEGSSMLTAVTFTGTAAELRDRVAGLEAAGVTELAYQPAGPDIPGELERMAAALA
jgi:5,10-methylenetetrahydromethanopterin reductase